MNPHHSVYGFVRTYIFAAGTVKLGWDVAKWSNANLRYNLL